MWADELDRKDTEEMDRAANWRLAAWIGVLALGFALYKWFWVRGMGTTGMMFIGLPAALSVAIALLVNPKSAKGSIMKGIAIAVLVVAPLAGEGYLCILFASPLFFAVGLAIGVGVDSYSKSEEKGERGGLKAWAWLALIPMALEGVTPTLSFGRSERVEGVRVVYADAARVETALAAGLRPETPMPPLLRIGFPRALAAEGTGLQVGDLRRMHFSGAEGDGPGDLVMRVAASGPGYVRFERVSDETHLRQWMAWEVSEVRWREIKPGETEVRWTIQFARRLDPAWYFGPWERFAVKQAAEYLITADAEPR